MIITTITNTTSLTGEGIYEITITTTDNVENTSTERKYTVKIDKTNRMITFDNGEVIDLLSDKYRKVLV